MLLVCLLVVASAIAVNAQTCGSPAVTPLQNHGRVVGGVEAIPHSWPWQISLRLKSFWGGDQHMCGGSLVNDQWIVTAAHCVDGRESTYLWDVWLGAHDTNNLKAGTIVKSLSKIVKNSGWNPYNAENDVALLKLSSPVQLTNNVNVVCMPSQSYTYTVNNGYVTGWGDTQENGAGSYPDNLRQVMTPIMDHNTCNQKMMSMANIPVAANMLCAGFVDGQKGACSGDSGGPYVVKNGSGQWELAGIVSWGLKPCAQLGVPSVYTDVYAFMDWIQNNMY